MTARGFTSDGVVGTILGLLAGGTIVLQVIMARSPMSGLEVALFSILQFVFSIGFAWVLSRVSFRREFVEGQKRFAVAAYRRICEVDAATRRLIARIGVRLSEAPSDLANELQILLAVALGIRQTAKSSIADWADIIGNEISTLQQIEELKDEQNALLQPRQEGLPLASGKSAAEMTGRVGSLEKQVEALRRNLPPSLQVLARSDEPRNSYDEALRILQQRLTNEGSIQLRGFWEPDAGFQRSIQEFKPGDELIVSFGDAGTRIGAVILCDTTGKSIGVITNAVHAPYYEFSAALMRSMGRSSFPVSLIQVEPPKNPNDRIYFVVRAQARETARADSGAG